MSQDDIVKFYQGLANQIPDIWYGDAELLKAAQPMLNHLKTVKYLSIRGCCKIWKIRG